ncbi:MAG: universal stress protein [Halobacteriaceae archaeon]
MSENDVDRSSAEDDLSNHDLDIREPPRVLIPVEVLEGESISESLVEFLAPSAVILVGYHVLPEQTPTEQASMQYEDKARQAIDDIAEIFRDAERDVETRVVFTHDRDRSIDRVATEVGATAILLPNPSGEIRDVVVPLRGSIDIGRLADLVATLLVGQAGNVTLWGLVEGESEFDAESAVDCARNLLIDRGLPAEQITTETTIVDSPIWDIVDRSDEFDLIVMGEGGPSLLTSLFGDPAERVAEGAVAPVIVVREGHEENEHVD